MTNESELVRLSRELSAVQANIADLRTAEATLKTQIADAIAGEVGLIKAGDVPVFDVSYSRKFSPAEAAKVLASNPDLLAACSETVISSKKAKAVLPPAVYELCQVASDAPTIKPKVSA